MLKRSSALSLSFCFLLFSVSSQGQTKQAIPWGGTVELQNGKMGEFANASGRLRDALTLTDALSYLTDGVPLLKQEQTNSIRAIEFLPFAPEEVNEAVGVLEHVKYFQWSDPFFPNQTPEGVCDLRKARVTIVSRIDKQAGYPIQGSPVSILTVFMWPNEITLGDEYHNAVFPPRATRFKAIRSR